MKETGIRILAVVGLAAILGLAAFGIIRGSAYVPALSARLSSAVVSLSGIFHRADKITLESNKLNLDSGDTFTLSWKKTGTADGTYSLSYPCKDTVSLSTVSGSTAIACDKPFTLASGNNKIDLKIVSTKNRFADAAITLSFAPKDANGSVVSAGILLLVNNAKASGSSTSTVSAQPKSTASGAGTAGAGAANQPAAVTAGQKTEKIYPIADAATVTNQTGGNADLVPSILEIGIIDKLTNTFVATTTLKAYDRIAVRFQVENKGGTPTGSWYFNAVLPTYPSYIFTSDGQQSLNPGDRIEFVIGFDHIQGADNNVVTINVDPTHSINESNEDNNIVKTTINGVQF